MTVPRLRTKARKARRRERVVNESDQSDYESDGELERIGCPFDDSERIDESYFKKMPDPKWKDVAQSAKFPWLMKPTENSSSGLRGLSAAEFIKLTPFQALCLFMPLNWYTRLANESNNYAEAMKSKKRPQITNKEILNFHALALAMAISPLDNKEEHWWTTEFIVLSYPYLGRLLFFFFCYKFFSIFLFFVSNYSPVFCLICEAE
jgi:hypothetical protein